MSTNDFMVPSVVDITADLMNLEYLPDINDPSCRDTKNLPLNVRDIPTGAVPLRDRNAAINYLSQAPPAGNDVQNRCS